jgi:hypothetical protein
MKNGIELMRDDKRILMFYPLIGETKVIKIDELKLSSIFQLRCRLVSKEDFDMGLVILGIDK